MKTSAPQNKPKGKKRNLYISYIKGMAIIGIILIHLIDWSDVIFASPVKMIESWLLLSVFLFMLVSGSVVWIAHEHKPTKDQIKRLLFRGSQILLIYYGYNLIKLFAYDFAREPLYYRFSEQGTLDAVNILFFRSYTVPITILVTFAFLMAVSPIILFLSKKSQRPILSIALLIAAVFLLDYLTPIYDSSYPVIDFLYSKNYVQFALMLWLIPFLIGLLLALAGFERQKLKVLFAGALLVLATSAYQIAHGQSLNLNNNEFPLTPYFIAWGLFALALLMYFFRLIEKFHNKFFKALLAALRLLGDHSLHIYIYQWLVIDLTRWVLPPAFIWLTVPIFFGAYLIASRQKLLHYYHYQKESTRDMAEEIL